MSKDLCWRKQGKGKKSAVKLLFSLRPGRYREYSFVNIEYVILLHMQEMPRAPYDLELAVGDLGSKELDVFQVDDGVLLPVNKEGLCFDAGEADQVTQFFRRYHK